MSTHPRLAHAQEARLNPVPLPPAGRPTSAAATDAARESQRLAALQRLDVLDTPREEAFDRISRLTKKLLKVPVSTVSFIDGHRQWFKALQGLTASEAPREHTFCNQTIQEVRPLVVPDATKDPRFVQNPLARKTARYHRTRLFWANLSCAPT